MASLDEHIGLIEGQLECVTEQGHIKQPNEFWAIHEVWEAVRRLRTVFKTNDRRMDDD